MLDPAQALRLDGRVAIVTGGTRGIGRAIAEAYASAGADVMVVARKRDELDETVGALEAIGARAAEWQGSTGDDDTADAAVQHCISTLGRVDVVVNNAATNPPPAFGPLIDADLGAVAKVFDTNIVGPLRFAQAAWRGGLAEHGGAILNVASIGGVRVGPAIGAYNVSKAALIHLTRQLAHELAPSVRVNAVAPALVKTDMARALWEPNEEVMAGQHPLGRLGVPDDVAGAALFLVSDAASWITGETVMVDGGALVR